MKCKMVNLAASCGAGAILLGLLAAGPAHAGTSTGSMQVSANVAGACTISASPMSFGVLSLSGGNTTQQDTSTTVSYSCNITPTAFTVGTGLNDASATGSGYNYAMANGTNYISYGLDVYDNSATFTLANAAVPGTPGSQYNVVDGANSPTLGMTGGPYTLSARIPASQTTIAGTYDDTVTFTMAF
ncbi:MAG TPA: spore coat protein U domain-containing protein [Acidocella sp.]|jgi:spore coat protein U-like protein|uniref:spore coat protein U domain-containing protein n=1 Tax=Acidocella sp. TaxID=50710 RepID=UPI002CEACCD5|nr:spore coat protein U domain-containing protein [Acidocella sp.]HVE23388.1 spore coat protein U domain-containing protein [Acidocella sp.]